MKYIYNMGARSQNIQELRYAIFYLVKIVSLLHFVLLISCNETKDLNYPERIIINPVGESKLKRSDLFSLEDVVWLENSNEFLLGGREGLNIMEHDNRIVVSSRELAFFTYEGKFLEVFGNRGRGKGEYLTNFYINPCNDGIRLLDRSGQKFIDYDKNGNYANEYPIEFYANSFICVDDKMLVYAGYELNEYNSNLLLYDDLADLIDHEFEFSPDETAFKHAFNITNFFNYKDSVRFINPFSDTIWNINLKRNKMELEPRFMADFGDYSIPSDFHSRKFENIIDYHQELAKKNYCHSIWSYWETDLNVFFIFRHGNSWNLAIYCKENKKSISVSELTDDIVFKGVNMSIFIDEAAYYYPLGDKICFVVEAWKFRELVKQVQQNMTDEEWVEYTKERSDIIGIFNRINVNDNPVMLILKPKNIKL